MLIVFIERSSNLQLYCSLVGSLTGTAAGMYLGYTAPALPSFENDPDAPFKMSEGEKSLFSEYIIYIHN
jgi:hypothetical protein